MTITPATMCVVLDAEISLLVSPEETIYIQLTQAHILHDNVVKKYIMYTKIRSLGQWADLEICCLTVTADI